MSAPSTSRAYLYGRSPQDFLVEAGWEPSGRITNRRGRNGNDHITWWTRGRFEYPQFLALDLERLGWMNILETL